MKIEVYDNSVEKIFLMPETLSKSLIKNNGIKVDTKGKIVSGRYALATDLDIENSGVDSIVVVDWMTKKETLRSFVEQQKEVIEDKIEETKVEVETEKVEEGVVEKIVDNKGITEKVEEKKPVKKTRGRKKKEK